MCTLKFYLKNKNLTNISTISLKLEIRLHQSCVLSNFVFKTHTSMQILTNNGIEIEPFFKAYVIETVKQGKRLENVWVPSRDSD